MKRKLPNPAARFFRRRQKDPEWPPFDAAAEIEAIRRKEAAGDPGLGHRIHHFEFHEFELQLDRDITGTYRMVVNQGRERRFSFSIRCAHRDYGALLAGIEEITGFLSGSRHVRDLPRRDDLAGHYYGGS